MFRIISTFAIFILLTDNLLGQCTPPLVLTTSSTPSTCGLPNGTANVLITDPIGTYTYAWSPGGGNTATVANLAGGNYSVVVTDEHGCSVTGNVSVATSTPVTLVTSSTPSQCNASVGSASVVASGGTAPYTYSWSSGGGNGPTASNLTSGNFTVTVTDATSNCTATQTVTIINSNAPVVDVVTTPTSCSSPAGTGTAVVSATGGTGNYTYLWPHNSSNAASQSNLTAGSYTVIVMDGVCTVVKTFVIAKEQNTIHVNTVTQATTCGLNNGSIIVTFGAAPGPHTFVWTPDVANSQIASNLPVGNYSVHVTDANGCTGTANASVVTTPIPTIQILSIKHPTCFGGNDGYYTYSINGAATQTSAMVYGAGIHNETIQINSSIAPVVCHVPYTVEFIDPPQIVVTPTVTAAACNTSNGAASVSVTGGVSPYTYDWSSGGNTTSVTGQPSGIISLEITDANGCSVTEPVNIPSASGPVLATSSTPSTCGNGTATVNASGGTSPYSYSWSPGGATVANPTALAAGIYTVTVTGANNCSTSQQLEVLANHTLDIMLAGQHVISCGQINGSIYPTVQGQGPSPSGNTYLWMPGGQTTSSLTNLNSGVYSVYITDQNGCTGFKEIEIGSIPSQVPSISNIVHPSCHGSYDGHYDLSWISDGTVISTNTTVSGLNANTYTGGITGGTQGCSGTFTVVLIDPPLLAVSVTSTNGSCSAAGSATVAASGGTGALSYSWSPSGGTGATASNLAPGNYTVTVTDANGCSVQESATITSSSTLLTTSSSTPASCGMSNGSATIVPAGGTAPYTYAWSPSGGTGATASNLAAGNYTVTVTDASNCTATETITVSSPSGITATATATTASCGLSNGSASVTPAGGAAPYTYAWSPSGGTGATASNLAGGNYTVIVTDANNCTTTASATVAATAAVTVTTTSTAASCGLSNGSATVTPTGGATPYTYAWSPSGGTGATASNLAAGNYTVTVTDANNCTATGAVTVSATAGVTATITPIATSCGLSNGSATVTPTGGATPYTYAWSPSGGTGATASNLTAGNYTVTVTDANNCTVTESVSIASSTSITAATSTTAASCGLSNGSATVTPSGGNTPYTYVWSPSGGTAAMASNLPAGNYTVTVTDANNCTTTQPATVSSTSGLTATAISTPASCGVSNGTLNVQVSGGTAPYTYAWSPNVGTTASVSNVPGGDYTVIVTDANNCTVNSTVNLYANTSITATATTTPASCGLSNGSATVTPTSGTAPYTYAWSPSGGTAATASNLAAGNYTVLVTDANNCTASQPVTIGATAGVSVTATAGATCASSGTATAAATGGTAPYAYSWSPAGGTGATASNLAPGNYTVTVTDAANCSASANVVVTTPSAPAVSTTATPPACFAGSNGSATAIVNGGTAPYSYLWSPAGGTGATALNLEAGVYTVTVTDNNGCTQTQSVTVTQPASLAVTTSGNPARCDGTPGSLNAVTSGGTGAISYVWQPGNLTGPSHSGIAAGVYSVTVTDANGCSTTATSTVQTTGSLPVDADPPSVWIDAGDTVQLYVTDYAGATYSWSPSTGLSCTDCFNPQATPAEATVYTVTVTAPDGCTGTADVLIKFNIICTEHFIPTIFSPNGDSNNDEFLIMGNCISRFNVKVFDRWGEKVFESNDQSIGWDGTYKGQPMNPASFVFVASLTFTDGTSLLEKGNLTLVR